MGVTPGHGLRLSRDSPGRTRQGVPSSEPAAWVPTCLRPWTPLGTQRGAGAVGADSSCYVFPLNTLLFLQPFKCQLARF